MKSRLSGTRLITRWVVTEHQNMLLLLVPKEKENAFLFHQSHDEVTSGLAILNAIFPRFIGTLSTILKILETEPFEYFL